MAVGLLGEKFFLKQSCTRRRTINGFYYIYIMDITTYSNFRQNLKSFLDGVLSSHTPLYVKRAKGEDVVVLSKSDYESMEATLYLLSSDKNRTHLMESIRQAEKGDTVQQDLDDLWK